jgi:hypothetical protein
MKKYVKCILMDALSNLQQTKILCRFIDVTDDVREQICARSHVARLWLI